MKQTTLLLLLIFTLVACGTAEQEAVTTVDETVNEVVESAETDSMAENDTMDDDHAMADNESMSESDSMAETVVDVAAWQTIELVDAQTGETFTFADYAGETIFVEPFATWCTNCKRQLTNVMSAMNTVHSSGHQNVKYVVLSVETSLPNEVLADYANAQAFPFQFAVATPDLIRMLVDEFGSAVTSAPSTPHFIIQPDGTTTELATGMESAEEIAAELLSIQ